MKLGFVSSILDGWTFEEMIDTAAAAGFQCAEAASWPGSGSRERRYAGVCHVDAEAMDDTRAEYIRNYCAEKHVEISSLAFYPNTMDADPVKREANIRHLKAVIDASRKLGINMVTTFIGRDQNRTPEDNLKLVGQIWPEIIRYAEDRKVRIAIENCPMLFGADQWPGGQNLMNSPANWDRIFDILDSDCFGLNFDPSHFVWQMMDYIEPVYKYREKLFHVHFKDIRLYPEKLKKVGTLAYPLDYMAPKLPGQGDVDWGRFISALTDVGYDGCACIEVEDRAFEGSREKVLESLLKSKKYLEQFPM